MSPKPVTPMEDMEFETVVEESGAPIEFENVNDQFVGEYLGNEVINPTGNEEDAFTVHKFRDSSGAVRKTNGGYKLNVGLEGIAVGTVVRITRVTDVPISDPGKNPMKDYRIEAAKGSKPAASATDES